MRLTSYPTSEVLKRSSAELFSCLSFLSIHKVQNWPLILSLPYTSRNLFYCYQRQRSMAASSSTQFATLFFSSRQTRALSLFASSV
jgi:hypothetical protein